MSASRKKKLGLYSALQIANGLGISVHELLAALGSDLYSLRMTSCDASLQRNLGRVQEIVRRLRHLYSGDMDAVRTWLRAPQLEGKAPLQLLERGNLTVTETLVDALEKASS